MSRKFCKENHPTFIKLEKILKLMDDLQIQIDFNDYHTTVHDKETGKSFYLEDMEDDGNRHTASVTSIPHTFEHKLIVKE